MITLNETELIEITNLIIEIHKLDLRNYAKSSFSRRITRIMTINALNSMEQLIEYIKKIKDLDIFIEEITVNTTEMFRDPSFWKVLRTTMLPELNTHENIRIWHAGCSSGEEVVSMQILLSELGMQDKVTTYATDIDKAIIMRAESGIYSLKNLALNQDNYIESGGKFALKKYFVETDAISYTINKDLLKNVKFKKFDLVKEVMYTKFDLILCRNVLIYFDFSLQEKVIEKFISSLFNDGFVAIGQKETLLSNQNLSTLNLFDAAEKIYRLNR